MFTLAPKPNIKWSQPSRWSVHILMKKNGGTTLPGATISSQRPVDKGMVATWESLKSSFWKKKKRTNKQTNNNKHPNKQTNTACMVLKLTVYVRNVIFVFYKPKTRWNFDIWNCFGNIFNFGLCFTKNRLFWDLAMLMTS